MKNLIKPKPKGEFYAYNNQHSTSIVFCEEKKITFFIVLILTDSTALENSTVTVAKAKVDPQPVPAVEQQQPVPTVQQQPAIPVQNKLTWDQKIRACLTEREMDMSHITKHVKVRLID